MLTTSSYPLETLLSVIINEYLISSYCVTFVSEISIGFHSSITPITYLVPSDENLTYQLLEVSEMGCSDYVVQMRKPQNFVAAIDNVSRIGNTRRSDRKIVFLPFDEETDYNETVPQVLEMKETSKVANILIVAKTETVGNCVSYDLITHKFTGPEADVNKEMVLDTWNSCTNTFERGVNLFPHDMKNLQGKTLKVACFSYQPYVLLDVDKAIEPTGVTGIDIKLVEEFCRWVNCSVEIVRQDNDTWGEVYENGTGIGILGSVVEDKSDVGVSALYSWYEEYKFMDFSTPYIRSAITCIAPAPRKLSSWDIPLMPFTWHMWCAVIFTFIYASIGLIVVHGCSTDRIFLTVFGMMIGQSQFEQGVTWKARSITGWLTIAGLLLASAYGAGLATIYTVPQYEPSLDTVKDIVDRRMEWGATHDAWIYSLTLSSEPEIVQLVNQFQKLPSEELFRRSFTRSMAFSIEKLPAGTFAVGQYITKKAVLDMMIMLEKFYYEQCVVMMRKSSPYTEKMSELIGRLHQSGLLLAWETQVALKHLDYNVQLEVKLSRSNKDVGNINPLNLDNVMGIFILYSIGAILSCVILVGEIIYKRYEIRNLYPVA